MLRFDYDFLIFNTLELLKENEKSKQKENTLFHMIVTVILIIQTYYK